MKFLLLDTTEIVLIAILGSLLIFAIWFFIGFKSKNKKKDKSIETIHSSNLALNDKYLFRKELKFFYILRHLLPKEYIIFPKVGIDQILQPVGSKIEYKKLASKYVDFVIFEEATMKPLIAIDIFDNTFGDEELSEHEPMIIDTFNMLNFPCISIEIKKEYDLDKLKSLILETINASKNKDIETNSKNYD